MVVNRKPTGTAVTIPAALAWGAVISLSATVAGSAITAALLSAQTLDPDKTGYCVMVIVIVAAFLGAVTACAKAKRRILALSALSGICYFAVLLATTALFFGGKYTAVPQTALLILCGTMLAVLWGFRRKKPPKWKVPNR